MLKDHEKFWAFIVLVGAIMCIAGIAMWSPHASEQHLRILEKVNDGLLVVLGAAGLALFRTSEGAKDMNDLLRSAVDRLADSSPTPLVQSLSGGPEAGAEKGESGSSPLGNAPELEIPQTAKDAANQVADAATSEAERIAGKDKS